MTVRVFLVYKVISMYVLADVAYVLICQVKKKKICGFENALVEKGESSTRNKNGLVEGLNYFQSKCSP